MQAFAVCLSLLMLVIVLPAHALEYYQVNGSNINVRKGPGQNWHVIDQIDKDQLVLETRREGLWSEVFFLTPNKQKVKGWVFNRYLSLQSLQQAQTPSPFRVTASAQTPVCANAPDYGSLCYLDIAFSVQASEAEKTYVDLTCWADFVVPGKLSITPIQTKKTKRYTLLAGSTDGVMRLKVQLNHLVNQDKFSVAYYNCAVQ